MKRILFACVLSFLCAVPALAQSKAFNSAVMVNSDVGAPVYVRYFTPSVTGWNLGGGVTQGPCTVAAGTYDAGTAYCQIVFNTHNTPNTGYRGQAENIFNFQKDYGTVFYAVFDMEQGTGTASHAGYYFAAAKGVQTADTGAWWLTDCGGTNTPSSCLGQGNATNAAGTAQTVTAAGTVNPIGGFRPIPVPKPVFDSPSGNLALSWTAASIVSPDSSAAALSYDLYVAKKACGSSVLSTDYALLKNVTGTSTSVAKADLALSGNTCAWFAIGLHYPSAGTTAVASRYLSANSLPVSYDASAATVTGLRATYMRNLGVQVTFKTTSESNTQGFYIARSFSANGPFVRVSPLIAAKGEANSYTYMDATRALVLRGGKVYYRVDVVSRDGKANSFGPVFVDIPGSNNRAPLTPATNSRFATQR